MKASKSGLCGLEFAYGIPGTVGGAVFMNAGAYGGQMSDVVYESKCYNFETDKIITIDSDTHCFSYRKSLFCDSRIYIVSTVLKLVSGDAESSVALCEENLNKRRTKQPLRQPSCGSAFKRPEGYFAGELIENAGLKGYSFGGAAVSEKHAGFIINKGGATTSDVLCLIDIIKNLVFKKFGVELEPEIRVLQ